MFNVAANEFRVGTCAQLRERLFTLLPKQRSSSTTTAAVCELTQTSLEILKLVREREREREGGRKERERKTDRERARERGERGETEE